MAEFKEKGLRASSLPKLSISLAIFAFSLGWIPTFGVPIGIFFGGAAVVFAGIGLTYAPSAGDKRLLVSALLLGVVSVALKFIPGVNVL